MISRADAIAGSSTTKFNLTDIENQKLVEQYILKLQNEEKAACEQQHKPTAAPPVPAVSGRRLVPKTPPVAFDPASGQHYFVTTAPVDVEGEGKSRRKGPIPQWLVSKRAMVRQRKSRALRNARKSLAPLGEISRLEEKYTREVTRLNRIYEFLSSRGMDLADWDDERLLERKKARILSSLTRAEQLELANFGDTELTDEDGADSDDDDENWIVSEPMAFDQEAQAQGITDLDVLEKQADEAIKLIANSFRSSLSRQIQQAPPVVFDAEEAQGSIEEIGSESDHDDGDYSDEDNLSCENATMSESEATRSDHTSTSGSEATTSESESESRETSN